MPTKRNSIEADLQPISTTKRARLSDMQSNSSDSSEASALRSSPSASEETRATSISSDDDEESSVVSSSSEEDSSSDEEEEFEPPRNRITELGQPIVLPQDFFEQKEKLLTKLREFMPRLQKANAELEKGGKSMEEEVEEGEEHIEMELGLGVLEEKREGSGSGSGSEEEEDGREVMQRLMGKDRTGERKRVDIEEVKDGRVAAGREET